MRFGSLLTSDGKSFDEPSEPLNGENNMRRKICLLTAFGIITIGFNANIFASLNSQEKNVAIAKKLFEYFNKHEWEKMVELYSDPAEFLDPDFGKKAVMRTRQQTIQKHKGLQAMSKDIRDDVVQIFP